MTYQTEHILFAMLSTTRRAAHLLVRMSLLLYPEGFYVAFEGDFRHCARILRNLVIDTPSTRQTSVVSAVTLRLYVIVAEIQFPVRYPPT